MANEQLKTTLKVVLQAGEQTIAESEDPDLWQKVLRAITGKSEKVVDLEHEDTDSGGGDDFGNNDRKSGSPLSKFAAYLKVDVKQLQGVCDPTEEEPYLHLDHNAWAAWRKATPERGTGAVSAVGIAATLLGLWFMQLKIGNVKQTQIAAALNEINVDAKNPARSIRNCPWLQPKDKGEVRLHPSNINDAVAAMRAFITGQTNND